MHEQYRYNAIFIYNMSLYVVPENQELLWNVISKNIYIRDYFAPYNPEKKNEWFKTIIRMFYERYKMQNLTVADVNNVNKETISYMIQNIREEINQTVAKTSAPTQSIPSYQPANAYVIPTPPIVPDTRQDVYAKEFEQRQQEYANLNKKVIPADVNFTEKTDDGVIQNMDELVKQQMQQRAYEMTMIPPPVDKISQTSIVSPINTVVQIAPPKLQADTTSNIEISIEELGLAGNKKNVTWKTDETTSNTQLQVTPDINHVAEIQLLRESVNNMSRDLVELKQLFELSQTSVAELKESNAELTTKLNHLNEWSQTSVAALKDSVTYIATKLNNSIEWSQLSIVGLNESNTGLAMKYNELIANQVAISQQSQSSQTSVQDEIDVSGEPILPQMNTE